MNLLVTTTEYQSTSQKGSSVAEVRIKEVARVLFINMCSNVNQENFKIYQSHLT